jgi:hypothetical protein
MIAAGSRKLKYGIAPLMATFWGIEIPEILKCLPLVGYEPTQSPFFKIS